MPKRIIKLCKLCNDRHRFRRSLLKQMKRAGLDICTEVKVTGPTTYFEGTLTRGV